MAKKKKKNTYVTTNPEDGWDCVGSVYIAESEEKVQEYILKESGYDSWEGLNEGSRTVIHEVFDITEIN